MKHALEIITTAVENGNLHTIDYHFAKFIATLDTKPDQLLLCCAALLSRLNREKSTCLELSQLVSIAKESGLLELIPEHNLPEQLYRYDVIDSEGIDKPLVLRNRNLYLQRYAQAECNIAATLQQLARPLPIVDLSPFKSLLQILFNSGTSTENTDSGIIDKQQLATCVGLAQQLTIICGGPGTGKTTTAVKLLILSAAQFEQQYRRTPIIKLAAPTGKAAVRLSESINRAKQSLAGLAKVETIPNDASTLHRLLKINNNNNRHYHRQRPLPVDILLVDEASMMDLLMTSQLFTALPSHCRLILLGDQYQLDSVESGSVLSDLCANGYFSQFSNDMRNTIETLLDYQMPSQDLALPLTDALCELTHSYRFSANSGIAWLAQQVRSSGSETTFDWQHINAHYSDLEIENCDQNRLNKIIEDSCEHFKTLSTFPVTLDNLGELLKKLPARQILSATRQGNFGTEAINANIENALLKKGLISQSATLHYHCRPIIIEENDYHLSLFNGDIGIIVNLQINNRNQLLAAFADQRGKTRLVSPQRLPRHSSVFAMTVHKSQGSEFEHCILIVNEGAGQKIISQSLIYTGITRAKSQLTLLANLEELPRQVQLRPYRSSGLKEQIRTQFTSQTIHS